MAAQSDFNIIYRQLYIQKTKANANKQKLPQNTQGFEKHSANHIYQLAIIPSLTSAKLFEDSKQMSYLLHQNNFLHKLQHIVCILR